MPYAVCTLETLYVSFGFSIAKTGLTISSLKPILICFSSSWITQELDVSLPEAAIVNITPIGKAFFGLAICKLKSNELPL